MLDFRWLRPAGEDFFVSDTPFHPSLFSHILTWVHRYKEIIDSLFSSSDGKMRANFGVEL